MCKHLEVVGNFGLEQLPDAFVCFQSQYFLFHRRQYLLKSTNQLPMFSLQVTRGVIRTSRILRYSLKPSAELARAESSARAERRRSMENAAAVGIPQILSPSSSLAFTVENIWKTGGNSKPLLIRHQLQQLLTSSHSCAPFFPLLIPSFQCAYLGCKIHEDFPLNFHQKEVSFQVVLSRFQARSTN